MHYRQKAARRATGRLFLRLGNRSRDYNDLLGVIKVNYAERFPLGECVISVVVPIGHKNIQKIVEISKMHQRYHYPPVIINGRYRRCLRLIFRFRNIGPNEGKRLLKYAKMIAEWAEKLFEMRALISPVPGLVGLLWRLRAF
ncbi:MAG TPA: hypothetical protein VJI70_00240 [Candidatus Paceibacterota bacterium]